MKNWKILERALMVFWMPFLKVYLHEYAYKEGTVCSEQNQMRRKTTGHSILMLVNWQDFALSPFTPTFCISSSFPSSFLREFVQGLYWDNQKSQMRDIMLTALRHSVIYVRVCSILTKDSKAPLNSSITSNVHLFYGRNPACIDCISAFHNHFVWPVNKVTLSFLSLPLWSPGHRETPCFTSVS
jgi:hypothetical protein